MIKKHKIIILFSILTVFFLAVFLWLLLAPNGNQIYTVKKENLVSTVLVSGTYITASQTKVSSPTNGVVTELFVSNNQQVEKGDKLFHVESTATESQKRTALATYLAAKSTLDADTAMLYSLQSTMFSKWKTFYDLATNGTYENSDKTPNINNRTLTEFTTAQDNWLAAEANYKNQQGVIAKDQAALAAAKQTYDETQSVTVTAPITGTVINLAAKVNDQTNTNSPVLIVADYSNPSLVATVDQVNIPKLKVGQRASIVFDALPDQTFNGTLTYLDIAGTKNQGTTNFNVYFTVNNLLPEIQLNMTASITVETARKQNVLTVPSSALIQKNDKSFVQLENKNLREVSIGLKGPTDVEITSGLSAGDKVIEQL